MIQAGENNNIPFEIKKVLVINGMGLKDKRGSHAHHKTSEILVVLQGGCEVELDNGNKKEVVMLQPDMSKALLLPPKIWRTLQNFHKDTILLVVADTEYDEKDYIRNYDDFLKTLNS